MKIEEGKRYVRRNGKISGPMRPTGHHMYPWRDWSTCYTKDGQLMVPSTHEFDLISEHKEPEMKEIDVKKPLRFVDNADELKYIGLDSRGFHVVEIVPVNALMQVDRYGKAAGWQDVENVPEKITQWCNFYPSGSGGTHATRTEADRSATSERIACVPVTFELGEGL